MNPSNQPPLAANSPMSNAPDAAPIEHTEEAHIPMLLQRCSGLLHAMYDSGSGLFSYSTRIVAGSYLNDFQHPLKLRYTINTLLGIQQALRFYPLDWKIDQLIAQFLQVNRAAITNPADCGLTLALLARANHPGQQEFRSQLQKILQSKNVKNLTAQDLGWMLFGCTTAARISQHQPDIALADELYQIIRNRLVVPATGLPCFSLSGARRRCTSFGGVVYVLMSLAEYGNAFQHQPALDLFRHAAATVIGLQGPQGEWPWFIDAKRGVVLDWYQVYSVHQDSMAMLWLLPALDLGMEQARPAIERSYRWLFGNNQLAAAMIEREPFFIHRSHRRDESLERPRRLLRSGAALLLGRPGQLRSAGIVLNPECRSYQIGWILYAWSGRNGFAEFTELALLQ